MKLKLGIVYTSNVQPKYGYLVFYNEIMYKIVDIHLELGTVTLAYVLDKSKTITVELEQIIDKYLKFIVIHERVMYSIIHGDYLDVITFLHEESIKQNISFDILVTNIVYEIDNVEITGNIKKIFCRIDSSALVEITNLSIIDNFKLFDKSDRLFKVISKINKGKHTRYIVASTINSDLVINTNRQSIKLVGGANYKDLFSIK